MTWWPSRGKSRLVPAPTGSGSTPSPAWDCRDDTGGGGGGGGGGEDVSEVEVVLGADERKRARIGHGGTGTKRRSFGDDKRRPRSVVLHLFLHNDG